MNARKNIRFTTTWIAAVAMLGSSAAYADSTFTGTLALTNDYVFRGLSQTNRDPALQGGVEYSHASGWYVGAWGSNVSWLSDVSTSSAPVSSSLELDLYGGWRGNVSDSVKLDAGLYTYYYPGEYPSGFVLPYTTEAFFGVSVGPASVKYYHSLTNLFGFADTDGSGYLDASVNVEFSPSWMLNAHAGRQRVKNLATASYMDWKLGVTKTFSSNWSLALAYLDTSADRSVYTNPQSSYLGRATGVVTVTRSF
ncbi:MAG: TorF family putative porin [Tahibacter sp.]